MKKMFVTLLMGCILTSCGVMRSHGVQKMNDFELLVMADIHYVHAAGGTCSVPSRKGSLGRELALRAFKEYTRHSTPDAILLLGDLVDNGNAEGADIDLAELEKSLRALGVPLIVVPGNHDGDPDRVLSIFSDAPGPHEVRGACVFTFSDQWDSKDVCHRREEEMQALAQECQPRRSVIVAQHNPIHPPIESSYPYMIAGSPGIRQRYDDLGVRVSLSGHYHPGQGLSSSGSCRFITCPALCEPPFRFLRVRMQGKDISVETFSLEMPGETKLFDGHCHTEFAYCGENVSVDEVVARARMFGLGGLCFAEHAGQLYISREGYWKAAHLRGRQILREGISGGNSRMEDFKRKVLPARSDFVKVGLEVECDAEGQLTLLEEDREGWDHLVGAVHWLMPQHEGSTQTSAELGFMRTTEALLSQGVHVLAHPLRYFRRAKWTTPKHLYRPLARLMGQAGVAAEINWHVNDPDPEFFALCLEEGCKLALASDAHHLSEVGDFLPHVRVLHKAAGSRNLSDILYRPKNT